MAFIRDIKNISSTKKDLRNFGLIVGACFAAIGVVAGLRGHHYGIYLVDLGVILFVSGIIHERLLLWPQKAWMALAVVLGFIMTRVLLFVFFYAVIFPIGMIRKLGGKKFLDDRFRAGDKSYWKARPKRDFAKEDWEKQF